MTEIQGPELGPDEWVEVVEASALEDEKKAAMRLLADNLHRPLDALRAEWEKEILTPQAIEEAAFLCKAPIDGDELHEAIGIVLASLKDQPQGGDRA